MQQDLLLFAPAVRLFATVATEQHFDFADLDAVIYPALDFADSVDIGIVKQTMTAIRSLWF
ncbi:hypothetical protein LTSEALA_3217 [Salmonella enterica subsp. enterica serovar Alachua str. R6-377]|uniref:Uncharacterized protein n=1 Tax=Salmonella enterica subsp. enterica serovar Alachua str. R6-377 TaxID=913241 RepID=G5LQU7_SALET|nr:hypothetical protein LTSEALA_3217 [Salmonella enterica subsp. enterica serovar Alachua str. R6-377]